MNFDEAKAAFEAMVTYMQQDIENYAGSPKVSGRALDFRLKQANTLVDFYQAALARIAGLENALAAAEARYRQLHADSKKLILFCTLHGIDPDMVFHYTFDELFGALVDDIRFQPPAKTLNDIQTELAPDNSLLYHFKEEPPEMDIRQMIEQDRVALPHSMKYDQAKFLAERNRRLRRQQVSYDTNIDTAKFPAL